MKPNTQGDWKKLPKNFWRGKINSREDADEIAHFAGKGLQWLSVLSIVLFAVLGYWAIQPPFIDTDKGSIAFSSILLSLCILVCSHFIINKQSRMAAIIAFVLSLFSVFSGVFSNSGVSTSFGSIMGAWVAMRAIRATFKLHGLLNQSAES